MGTVNRSSIYQYYHVLECDVKLTYVNKGTVPFLVGYEIRDDASEAQTSITNFMESKQSAWTYINGADQDHRFNTATFTYHYEPHLFDHHVREVDSEERWTPMNSVININHLICPRIFLYEQADTTLDMHLMVEIYYKTQLREAVHSVLSTQNPRVGGS